MVRGGGLRTAVKTSAAVELLVGPRSDTPAHREWGPMSWHGRFGQADVNPNVRRGAAQRPWRPGPRFDGPRHDALDGCGRAATGTQAADMPRAALGAL
jgi:hypothetical protein